MLRIRSAFGCFVFAAGVLGCSEQPREKLEQPVGVAKQALVATQTSKLGATDPWNTDQFGNAVAISEPRLAVGSSSDDGGSGSDSGSGFVFVRAGNGWTLEARVSAADGAMGDEFGAALALAGDTLVVGARNVDVGANANQGAVYVFERNGSVWNQTQKIVAADGGRSEEQFGSWLGLDGETLAVGANGQVRIFARQGGTFVEVQQIAAPSGAIGEGFGRVALAGDHLLVGAPLARSGAGAAHKYTRVAAEFTLESVIEAPIAAVRFGTSVALSGDTGLIGTDDTDVGSAFVFSFANGGIQQQARLTAGDATVGDRFGATVALSGNVALVGAPFHEHAGANANHGSAYVFRGAGAAWTEVLELYPDDAQNNDHFGSAVAVTEDVALVGSPNDDVPFTANGSAYAFAFDDTHKFCSVAQGCPASDYCDSSGICLPKKANGRQCEPRANADCLTDGCQVCASGNCVDGICCESVCDGGCNSCSRLLTGLENGTCAPVRAGSDPKDACAVSLDAGSCGPDGFCNGQGSCRTAAPAGTRCDDPACGSDGTFSDFTCDGNGACIESVLGCGTGGTGTGGTGTGGTVGTGGTGGTGTGGTGTGGTGTGGTVGTGGTGTGGTDTGTGGTDTGTGGTVSPGSGGAAGTGAGGTAGSAGSGSGDACIRVAPNGDDSAALASNGATPFANVQAAIDFADTHRSIATNVCLAAGATCGEVAEYGIAAGSHLQMRNGISVIGKYESSGWTRCADSVTRIVGNAIQVVMLGPDISQPTTLEAVDLATTHPDMYYRIVYVEEAQGVRLVNIRVLERTEPAVANLAFGVVIQGGRVAILDSDIAVSVEQGSATGVDASLAELTVENSRIVTRGRSATGVQTQSREACRIAGNHVQSFGEPDPLVGGTAVGISAFSILTPGHVVEDNDVEVAAAGNAVGIGASALDIAFPAPTTRMVHVTGNRVWADSNRGTGIWAAYGVSVTANEASTESHLGGGEIVGIQCGGCVELRENVASARFTVTDCPTPYHCEPSSAGALVQGFEGTVVEGNDFSGGCGRLATGLSVTASARVQNNFLSGGDCPDASLTKSAGVSVTDPYWSSTVLSEVELFNNFIDGGGTEGACTSVGIELLAQNKGPVVANNLIVPGRCNVAFNVDQTTTRAYPTRFLNNDLAPGLPGAGAEFYRIQGAPDYRSFAEINHSPASYGNFSDECPLPLDPVESSSCIDTGFPGLSPALDYEGDARADGMPDVGPDELASE
jgi:hypothetical protein